MINLLNDPGGRPGGAGMQVRKVTTPHRKMTTIVGWKLCISVDHYHSPDGNYTSRDDHYTTPGDAYDSPDGNYTLQVMGMKLLIPISLRQQILSKRPNSSIPARKEITLHRMPGICHLRKLTILLKGTTQLDKHVIG